MIVTFTVQADDLVTAIRIAEQRARNDGYTSTSIMNSVQRGNRSWEVTLMVSRNDAATHRI